MERRPEYYHVPDDRIPDNPVVERNFRESLKELAKSDPRSRGSGRNDVHLPLYAQGMLNELDLGNEGLRKELLRVKLARPTDTEPYLIDIGSKRINMHHQLAGDFDYVEMLKDEDDWQEKIREVFSDSPMTNMFWLQMPNMRMDVHRYLAAKFISSAFRDRVMNSWGGTIDLADGGAGRGHGVNGLMLDSTNPDQMLFSHVDISEEGFYEKKPKFSKNDDLTDLFTSKVVVPPVPLESAIAFDQIPRRNEDFLNWAISCCYPGEFGDRMRRLGFVVLDYLQPGVSFEEANCASISDLRRARNGRKSHMFVYSLVFNQMTDSEIEEAIEAALDMLVDDGILVIVDGAKPDKNAPNGLKRQQGLLYSAKRHFDFHVSFKDKKYPELGWQHAMRLENGAFLRAIINKEIEAFQNLYGSFSS